MTVDQLRERLAEVPGYLPVAVRIVVGGDLVTDDVDLVEVTETGGHYGNTVVLVPRDDLYDVRDLIDEGLEARALAERRAAAAAQVRT